MSKINQFFKAEESQHACKNSESVCHIAIIPDGNRRWAKTVGIRSEKGHRIGVRTLEKILNKWIKTKVPYFTFWGSSLDNITKRTRKEINFLFRLITQQFKRIAKDKRIHQNKVRINVLGRWQEVLSEETKRAIKRAIDKTKDYNEYFLTFLLAYDGQDEMIDCILHILKTAQNKVLKVTEKVIKEHFWTKDLPPVDLVIRTGCEDDPHMSAGFMMWDTSYSQYYFTKTFFPSFTPKEFGDIINDYLKRERRMGK